MALAPSSYELDLNDGAISTAAVFLAGFDDGFLAMA
jgi:hypothetical protein